MRTAISIFASIIAMFTMLGYLVDRRNRDRPAVFELIVSALLVEVSPFVTRWRFGDCWLAAGVGARFTVLHPNDDFRERLEAFESSRTEPVAGQGVRVGARRFDGNGR
jgi:hypothetical protein